MNDGAYNTLLNRLRAVDRLHQSQTALGSALRSVKWLLLGVVALLLLDIGFHLENQARLWLDLLALGATLLIVGTLVHRAWWHRDPLERVARRLEDQDASLGSKLINVLQLQERFLAQPETSALTRKLAEQAVEDAAGEVNHAPLMPLARNTAMPRLWLQAMAAVVVFVGLCLGFIRPAMMTVLRYLDPFGDHPAYSLTTLVLTAPAKSGDSVLYRRSYLVRAGFSGHDPTELELVAKPIDGSSPAVTVPMFRKNGEAEFQAQLESVTVPLNLYVQTKSGWSRSALHPLGVILTPQFESATLTLTPPAYTGLPEKQTKYDYAPLSVLKGTQVRLAVQSNRPLKSGTITFASQGATQPQELAMTPAKDQGESGAREVSTTFTADSSGRMGFKLVDESGIGSDKEVNANLTVTHDLAPTVTIANPPEDGFVVEGYPLVARIALSDDYGLASVRVHLGRNDKFDEPKVTTFSKGLRSEAISLPLMEGPNAPKAGEVICFFAEAVDTFPDKPHITRSATRRMMVISQQEYHDFLRQEHTIADLEAKYDGIEADLRQIIDQQKKLAEQAEALRKQQAEAADKLAAISKEMQALQDKQPDSQAAKEARDKALADLKRQQDKLTQEQASAEKAMQAMKQEQADINQALKQAADKMDQMAKEAPLYDLEKAFAEELQQQAQDIRDSVAKNDKDMSGAPSPVEMAAAAAKHRDRLGGGEQEVSQKMMEALKDAELMQELVNDFNAFQQLHQTQKQLVEQTAAYDKDSLTAEDRAALESLGAQQREVAQDLRQLNEKLREDADKGEKLFPKASASARKLSQAMDERRMDFISHNASAQMTRGEGKPGHHSAQRLFNEMDALFEESKNGQGQGQQEMDSQLSLQHGMSPGQTFSQMMQCRKLGMGSGKLGKQGQGMGGQMGGQQSQGGQAMSVFGNQTKLGRAGRAGDGEGKPNEPAQVGQAGSGGEVGEGMKQVNRETDAVPAATLIEQYRGLTEAYFNRITAPPKSANEPPKEPGK